MSASAYEFAIAGAGPAGCAAALRAARAGARVLLLERGRYPRQKVCGEFLSAQGVALLQDFDPTLASRLLESAPRVSQARVFLDGETIGMPIEPAAASVTRFALDSAMWKTCADAGVDCRQQTTVERVSGEDPFQIETSAETFAAESLLIAAGRWSNLRAQGGQTGGGWIGLKAHFREFSPPSSVDLYFFHGGYCGVQAVGADTVNACAMVRVEAARTLQEVFRLHPELEHRSRAWQPASEPLSTSPLVFSTPSPVERCILYAGDAAGFIDPFLGDGISLALHSGRLAADCLAEFWSGRVLLAEAAQNYSRRYRRELLPLFRNASLLRRSLSWPGILRKPLLSLLHVRPLARWLVDQTRPSL